MKDKFLKRLVTLLLIVAFAISTFSVSVFAELATTPDDNAKVTFKTKLVPYNTETNKFEVDKELDMTKIPVGSKFGVAIISNNIQQIASHGVKSISSYINYDINKFHLAAFDASYNNEEATNYVDGTPFTAVMESDKTLISSGSTIPGTTRPAQRYNYTITALAPNDSKVINSKQDAGIIFFNMAWSPTSFSESHVAQRWTGTGDTVMGVLLMEAKAVGSGEVGFVESDFGVNFIPFSDTTTLGQSPAIKYSDGTISVPAMSVDVIKPASRKPIIDTTDSILKIDADGTYTADSKLVVKKLVAPGVDSNPDTEEAIPSTSTAKLYVGASDTTGTAFTAYATDRVEVSLDAVSINENLNVTLTETTNNSESAKVEVGKVTGTPIINAENIDGTAKTVKIKNLNYGNAITTVLDGTTFKVYSNAACTAEIADASATVVDGVGTISFTTLPSLAYIKATLADSATGVPAYAGNAALFTTSISKKPVITISKTVNETTGVIEAGSKITVTGLTDGTTPVSGIPAKTKLKLYRDADKLTKVEDINIDAATPTVDINLPTGGADANYYVTATETYDEASDPSKKLESVSTLVPMVSGFADVATGNFIEERNATTGAITKGAYEISNIKSNAGANVTPTATTKVKAYDAATGGNEIIVTTSFAADKVTVQFPANRMSKTNWISIIESDGTNDSIEGKRVEIIPIQSPKPVVDISKYNVTYNAGSVTAATLTIDTLYDANIAGTNKNIPLTANTVITAYADKTATTPISDFASAIVVSEIAGTGKYQAVITMPANYLSGANTFVLAATEDGKPISDKSGTGTDADGNGEEDLIPTPGQLSKIIDKDSTVAYYAPIGDTNPTSYKIEVTKLIENGAPVAIPDGTVVNVYASLTDNTVIATATVSGGKATVDVPIGDVPQVGGKDVGRDFYIAATEASKIESGRVLIPAQEKQSSVVGPIDPNGDGDPDTPGVQDPLDPNDNGVKDPDYKQALIESSKAASYKIKRATTEADFKATNGFNNPTTGNNVVVELSYAIDVEFNGSTISTKYIMLPVTSWDFTAYDSTLVDGTNTKDFNITGNIDATANDKVYVAPGSATVTSTVTVVRETSNPVVDEENSGYNELDKTKYEVVITSVGGESITNDFKFDIYKAVEPSARAGETLVRGDKLTETTDYTIAIDTPAAGNATVTIKSSLLPTGNNEGDGVPFIIVATKTTGGVTFYPSEDIVAPAFADGVAIDPGTDGQDPVVPPIDETTPPAGFLPNPADPGYIDALNDGAVSSMKIPVDTTFADLQADYVPATGKIILKLADGKTVSYDPDGTGPIAPAETNYIPLGVTWTMDAAFQTDYATKVTTAGQTIVVTGTIDPAKVPDKVKIPDTFVPQITLTVTARPAITLAKGNAKNSDYLYNSTLNDNPITFDLNDEFIYYNENYVEPGVTAANAPVENGAPVAIPDDKITRKVTATYRLLGDTTDTIVNVTIDPQTNPNHLSELFKNQLSNLGTKFTRVTFEIEYSVEDVNTKFTNSITRKVHVIHKRGDVDQDGTVIGSDGDTFSFYYAGSVNIPQLNVGAASYDKEFCVRILDIDVSGDVIGSDADTLKFYFSGSYPSITQDYE